MNREIIPYTTEEAWLAQREQDLTSTDIAALFGLSPYKTAFELWHEKKSGQRAAFTENERAKWGKRLEHTVAAGIIDDQDWCGRPMKEYMRLPDMRVGSSFDWRIHAHPNSPDSDSPDDAILEIKTVDWLAFRDGWAIDEGFIEAPAHIEIQVQHQMLVSGLRRAFIGVMVGGNDIRVIERRADDDVHRGIIAKAREFWQSIDENNPPDPIMPDDAEAVIRMNGFAEPGKFFDGRGNADLATLLREYHQLGQVERQAKEDRDVRKAQILQIIGDHEKGVTDAGKFSAGMVGPTHVEYDRAGYRNFRFTPAKAAKEAAE